MRILPAAKDGSSQDGRKQNGGIKNNAARRG